MFVFCKTLGCNVLFQFVYCGHEYAIQNLKFGLHVEPNNTAIQEKIAWVKKRREENLPSVPSSIGECVGKILHW